MRAYSYTDNTITVIIDNTPYTVDRSHPQANAIMQAIKNNAPDSEIITLFKTLEAVKRYMNGAIEVHDDERVTYKGVEVDAYLVDKIMSYMKADLPTQPLINFIEEVIQIQNKTARMGLYRFLEHKNMPITDKGTFLAYKGVQTNFYSITAGKKDQIIRGKTDDAGHIFNGVGEELEVRRTHVDDNPRNHCSTGLHAGSLQYASGFGPVVVIVEINPRDVVAVPEDSDCQKLRTAKYRVVGIYTGKLPNHYAGNYSADESGKYTGKTCGCGCEDEQDEIEYCDECGESLEECVCAWFNEKDDAATLSDTKSNTNTVDPLSKMADSEVRVEYDSETDSYRVISNKPVTVVSK